MTSNLDNVDLLPTEIRDIVNAIFVQSLTKVWLFSLVCGCLAFLATFLMREGELEDGEPTELAHETDVDVPRSRGWLRPVRGSVWPRWSKPAHQ